MTQTTLPLPRFATEGLALLASADRHRLCRQRERVLLILGIVLAGVGFLHAATRKEMLLQALGLVGFGAMALLAAGATPLLGAYVAALGLLSHAVRDEYHHHADRAVARSFARFCATLDYTLAAIVVSLTTFTAVS
jgi:hypothetical protein